MVMMETVFIIQVRGGRRNVFFFCYFII